MALDINYDHMYTLKKLFILQFMVYIIPSQLVTEDAIEFVFVRTIPIIVNFNLI